MMKKLLIMLLPLLVLALVIGCGKKPQMEQETGPTTTTTPAESTLTVTPPENPDVGIDTLDVFNSIYFDFDKYNLRSDAQRDLQHNVEVMKHHPNWTIIIEGNCDERGTVEYNLALGEKRARAARDYLISMGVDGGRIEVISYGKEKPKALGHNEQAWAENRRDDFKRTDNY